MRVWGFERIKLSAPRVVHQTTETTPPHCWHPAVTRPYIDIRSISSYGQAETLVNFGRGGPAVER